MATMQKPISGSWYVNRTGKLVKVSLLLLRWKNIIQSYVGVSGWHEGCHYERCVEQT